MPLPIYAIHAFRPQSSISCFLARWCIRAVIWWHRADIVSKIGNPNTYRWIIWWVLYLYRHFLLDEASSRNLHCSSQGLWMAMHFKHWTVRAFKAGSLRFYTLHIYPVLLPEKFHDGGKHWVSRCLRPNKYAEIWLRGKSCNICFSCDTVLIGYFYRKHLDVKAGYQWVLLNILAMLFYSHCETPAHDCVV